METLERTPAARAVEGEFLDYETDLVLYRTIRVPCDDVSWAKVRMSMNDRDGVYAIRAKKSKFWRSRARAAALNVPAVEWGRVCVFYRFPTNHRREVANLQPTSKAIVDGLVDAGVFPDDNDNHMVGPDNRREPVNGPHQVVVRIYVRRDVT